MTNGNKFHCFDHSITLSNPSTYQNYHKTTVLCNRNNLNFSVSSSSSDRPLQCAILAGIFIDADHWFIQQELKGEEFNSPILKLERNRYAKKTRPSAACGKVMENSRLSITYSTCYAETGWTPSFAWRLRHFQSSLWDSSMVYCHGDLHVGRMKN